MRHAVALLLALLAMPLPASPRITYWRTIPAPYGQGVTGDVAVIYAHGEPQRVDVFLEQLTAEVNRGAVLQLRDVAERTSGGTQARGTPARARQHRAAAYLGLADLSCTSADKSGEASHRDVDGQRVWRRIYWLEATCVAKLDILSATLQRVDSFSVTAEGLSPKKETIDDQLRDAALDSAARYAARMAAEAIVPRRVHESIALDESAPAFDEAMTLIETSQPQKARTIWEKAIPANAGSAALRYNLGAVCEALGDMSAAEDHYRAAVAMRPAESRYATELKAFRRRQTVAGRR